MPGESYLAVLDGLYDAPSVEVVICRQEGGAAMMAEADGKLKGTPGVAMVTRAPGATNASAGVHIAFQDSTPMVLLVGQVGRSMFDREAFQEVDYRKMFGPGVGLAKAAFEINAPERIPEYMNRAFALACSGRPGPVVLALPEDVLSSVMAEEPAVPLPASPTAPNPDPAAIAELGGRIVRPPNNPQPTALLPCPDASTVRVRGGRRRRSARSSSPAAGAGLPARPQRWRRSPRPSPCLWPSPSAARTRSTTATRATLATSASAPTRLSSPRLRPPCVAIPQAFNAVGICCKGHKHQNSSPHRQLSRPLPLPRWACADRLRVCVRLWWRSGPADCGRGSAGRDDLPGLQHAPDPGLRRRTRRRAGTYTLAHLQARKPYRP